MLVLVGAILAVSADKSPQEKYIAKYSATAVREMYRTGVPASITLAQGLLESRYGQSELASKGNNHFGIKCHDWKGTMTAGTSVSGCTARPMKVSATTVISCVIGTVISSSSRMS